MKKILFIILSFLLFSEILAIVVVLNVKVYARMGSIQVQYDNTSKYEEISFSCDKFMLNKGSFVENKKILSIIVVDEYVKNVDNPELFNINDVYKNGDIKDGITFLTNSRVTKISGNEITFENLDCTYSVITNKNLDKSFVGADIKFDANISSVNVNVTNYSIMFDVDKHIYRIITYIENEGLLTNGMPIHFSYERKLTLDPNFFYIPKAFVEFDENNEPYVNKYRNIANVSCFEKIFVEISSDYGDYYSVKSEVLNDGNVIIKRNLYN